MIIRVTHSFRVILNKRFQRGSLKFRNLKSGTGFALVTVERGMRDEKVTDQNRIDIVRFHLVLLLAVSRSPCSDRMRIESDSHPLRKGSNDDYEQEIIRLRRQRSVGQFCKPEKGCHAVRRSQGMPEALCSALAVRGRRFIHIRRLRRREP